jgi:hypothetical protein
VNIFGGAFRPLSRKFISEIINDRGNLQKSSQHNPLTKNKTYQNWMKIKNSIYLSNKLFRKEAQILEFLFFKQFDLVFLVFFVECIVLKVLVVCRRISLIFYFCHDKNLLEIKEAPISKI